MDDKFFICVPMRPAYEVHNVEFNEQFRQAYKLMDESSVNVFVTGRDGQVNAVGLLPRHDQKASRGAGAHRRGGPQRRS